jgi:hypothetical protein
MFVIKGPENAIEVPKLDLILQDFDPIFKNYELDAKLNMPK